MSLYFLGVEPRRDLVVNSGQGKYSLMLALISSLIPLPELLEPTDLIMRTRIIPNTRNISVAVASLVMRNISNDITRMIRVRVLILSFRVISDVGISVNWLNNCDGSTSHDSSIIHLHALISHTSST